MYDGELVSLRALEREDIVSSHEFVNDYQIMRGAQAGMLYPSSFEDETRWADGQSSYTAGAYQFAVETRADHLFLGRCGFTRVDWKNRVAEMGILLGTQHGRGYGTDAAKVLCRFGFEELGLHKIKASVFDFNLPAIRAYEKAGFHQEGTLKQELWREGEYHDVILMAIFCDQR